MSSLPEVPTVPPRPRGPGGPPYPSTLPATLSAETGFTFSGFLPEEEPEVALGQGLLAIVAGFLPLVVALYAFSSAGQALGAGLKLALMVGTTGLYGAALWSIGRVLARRPERATAGRTLVIAGGVIAVLVGNAPWFDSRSDLAVLSSVGAIGLVSLSAGLHARLRGWRVRDLWPLVVAVVLLGLSGGLVPLIGRPVALVLDVVAAVLAGGFFLRPDRGIESAGRVALALAIPASSLLLKPFWWVSIPQLMAVAMCLLFVLRAVRPHLHAGTPALCALGLLIVHLLIAVDTLPTRSLGLLVAVAALLLLGRDTEKDSNAGLLDRRAFPWMAAFAWVAVATTWARDSGLVDKIPATGSFWRSAHAAAALALPFAVPAFLLSQWRRRTAPIEVDLEELPQGTVAEIAGWGVLAAAQVVSLYAGPTTPAGLVIPMVVAALGAAWSRALEGSARYLAAHGLLLAAVWGGSHLVPAALSLPVTAGQSLVLAASAVALFLSLAPWVGGSRATGMLGFAAFPILTAEALYRDASPHSAALLLGLYGLAHLVRPPLAEFPSTRLVGPAALVSAAWLSLSHLGGGSAGGARLTEFSRWFDRSPLPLLALLATILAVPLFLLSRRQRRLAGVDPAPPPGPDVDPLPIDLDPGFAFEAMGWALLALDLTLALTPFPRLTGASVAALVAGAVVSAIWAHGVSTPWRRGGAHVFLVAAVWAFGHWAGSPGALLAAPVAACFLALGPTQPLRGSEQAAWVGLVLLPFVVADSATGGASPLVIGAFLVVVGGIYVVRSPISRVPWTRGVGPLALAVGAWLLFSQLNPLLLASGGVPVAVAIALVPLALWVAVTGTPVVFLVEVIAGALAVALLDCTPFALLPLFILALGRGPFVHVAGAPALLAGGIIVSLYGPASGVPVGAAALAVGGGVLLFRALPEEAERLGLLGFPGLVAAPVVLAFLPRGSLPSFLEIDHLPLIAALAVVPFGLWLRRRPHAEHLVTQTLATAGFVAVLAIGAAFVGPSGTWSAAEAGLAGLLALATVVLAAAGVNPELRPLAWGFAAIGALFALAPTSRDPWHWPVTIVGAVDVLLLGWAARRRESPVLAAFALWSSLLVLAWMAAAFTERLVGGDLLTLVPAVGTAAAVAGLLVLWRGSGWLGAPPFFLRPFLQSCLVLAAVAAGMSLTLVPTTRTIDVVQTLVAATAVAALSLSLAFADRLSWPLFLLAGAIVLPYAFLRGRTSWLPALDGWDAVVAVVVGAVFSSLERPLRRAIAAPPIPAQPENPADLPFAVAELRLVAAMVTGLSAMAFLELHGLRSALGPFGASAYFLWRTRREEDNGPAYGILAAAFLNTTIVLLLLNGGIAETGAYTLPIFFSLALIMHAYREHLGHEVDTVRAIPAGIALLLCAYETVNVAALRPTLALACLGAGLLVLGRRFRLGSYLWMGLIALSLAAFDTAIGIRFASDDTGGNALRAFPVTGLLLTVIGAALLTVGPRLFQAPAELLRPFVNAAIVLAALLSGLAAVMAPASSVVDVGLTLGATLAVGGLCGVYAFSGDRFGWPLLITGGAIVVSYVFLRSRTDLVAPLAHGDAYVAVVAGILFAAFERPLRRASGAPARPTVFPEPPDQVPFGVFELRLLTSFVMALAAVAFFDFHRPIDAVAPALATLFFLWRTRTGNPIYGILAAALINATLVMFLVDRSITSPSAYALPFFGFLAYLLHLHRDFLSDQDSSIRVLPPIAAAAVCTYEAIMAKGQLAPALALAALGVILLLLARAWRQRSHAPIGIACLAAALLTAITEWNARGWTTAAIALGVATLLLPAFLLRWR